MIDVMRSASYNVQLNGIGELKIAGRLCKECSVKGAIGVQKSDPLLYLILEKLLLSVSDKKIEEIKNRWTLVRYKAKIDYIFIIKISALFIVIVAVILYGNRRLSREISRRKEAEEKLKELNHSLETRVKAEIKKNEYQRLAMFHQSRLAQMGEMLSVIAHQWRQPLSAIASTVSTLRLNVETKNIDTSSFDERLQKIDTYIHFLNETIHDFRDFFRPDTGKQKTTFTEITQSALQIIGESLNTKNIELHLTLESETIFETYRNELKQVVLNMIKNAEDALLEKSIKKPFISISSYEDETSIFLIISDNAGGIPEPLLPRVFEAYFTTKGKKKGTGLGLYMSKIIVEDHCKGELRVKNAKEGAVFTLSIPKV